MRIRAQHLLQIADYLKYYHNMTNIADCAIDISISEEDIENGKLGSHVALEFSEHRNESTYLGVIVPERKIQTTIEVFPIEENRVPIICTKEVKRLFEENTSS